GVPVNLFVQALRDADPFVQMQAINGLVRLGAVDRAEAIVPLTASPDSALSHVAVNALAALEARDAALRSVDRGTPLARAAGLRALQQMHDPRAVVALVSRADGGDPEARQEILLECARLAHREAT